MQSGTSSKPSPSPAAIVGIIGGALLVLGSFLTWATASVDLDALAKALGVDPALLQGAATGTKSFSVGGMDSGADGTFTLIAGIVAVAVAVVLILKADLKKPMGAVLVVAGLIGGGVALYDLSKVNDVKQEAIDAAGGSLAAAGIDTGVLDDVFDVSAGIGIWVCIAGGLVAIIGGGMAFAAKSAPAMTGGASTMGSGFDAPPPAPTAPMPSAEPAAAMPPPGEPAAPPSAEPAAAMPPPAEPAAPPPAEPTMPEPASAEEPAPTTDTVPDMPGNDQGDTTV
jgi:hypothetical protein